jgi:hypothetical protein
VYTPNQDAAKIQVMHFPTAILLAIERRHGPLHGLMLNKVDQWRWRRQLTTITEKPAVSHFSTLRVIHEHILMTSLEHTSPKTVMDLKVAWQKAGDAFSTIATKKEHLWLANNCFNV